MVKQAIVWFLSHEFSFGQEIHHFVSYKTVDIPREIVYFGKFSLAIILGPKIVSTSLVNISIADLNIFELVKLIEVDKWWKITPLEYVLWQSIELLSEVMIFYLVGIYKVLVGADWQPAILAHKNYLLVDLGCAIDRVRD
jgi:hypothetical protein